MSNAAAFPAGPLPEQPQAEAIDDDALPLVSGNFEHQPMRFVWHVARGRYRRWLMAMTLGEATHATCGILLPYALGKILSSVTAQGDLSLAVRLETLKA